MESYLNMFTFVDVMLPTFFCFLRFSKRLGLLNLGFTIHNDDNNDKKQSSYIWTTAVDRRSAHAKSMETPDEVYHQRQNHSEDRWKSSQNDMHYWFDSW